MSAIGSTEGGLKAGVGIGRLFALAFASIIGAGWVVVVGQWLALGGPIGAALAFAAAFVIVLLIALCYAEMANMLPVAGGEVSYGYLAFGPLAAFVVGWMLLLVYVPIMGYTFVSVGWILSAILPALRGPELYILLGAPVHLGDLGVGFACLGAITWANLKGAEAASGAQFVMMLLKIVASVLFLLAAASSGHAANLDPPIALLNGKANVGGLFQVFAMAMLFYAGFNYLPQAIEEKAPGVTGRQIAVAMALSLVAAFVFYVAIILGVGSLVPRAELVGVDLPAAVAFERAFASRFWRDLILCVGFIGILTTWNGTLFAASRITLMMGRTGLLPAGLAAIHQRSGIPRAAVIVLSIAAGLIGMAGRGVVNPALQLAGTSIPIAWAVVCAGAIVLRRREPNRARPFRTPGGVLMFALALAGASIAVLTSLGAAFDFSGPSGALVLAVFLGWSLAGVAVWTTGRGRRLLLGTESALAAYGINSSATKARV